MRMRATAAILLSLTPMILPGASAAPADQAPTTLPLWPDGAPGAQGKETGDAFHPGDVPTLTLYTPDPSKATGDAVVVCPGGGYGMLATEHEGSEVAEWLNSLGVTAAVLKYRLGPRYHHPAML